MLQRWNNIWNVYIIFYIDEIIIFGNIPLKILYILIFNSLFVSINFENVARMV